MLARMKEDLPRTLLRSSWWAILLGLLSAPVAFGVARAVHKGVAAAVAVDLPPGASPWLLAAVKAAEYAVFGVLVAGLARRQPPSPLSAFVVRGLLIGAAFGALLLIIMDRAAAPAGLPPAGLVARGVNELLFPAGCACVLWTTGALTHRAA